MLCTVLTNSVREVNIMITKESLQVAQATINEVTLKIKQSYSSSPTAQQIFLVVEGKDDIPYYGTRADEYIPEGWKVTLIPAQNRKKAVETYRTLDWTIYAKNRILFFIDRDLSDYTKEDTPNDSNVYVTTRYAIENELCTVDTYVKALKYYCDLVDISEADEAKLIEFYNSCWAEFSVIVEPIMAQILYWKENNIKSNYANYKMQNVIEIKNGTLQLNPNLLTEEDVLQDLFRQSNVPYIPTDISMYKDLLNEKHTPEEYIRGKFVVAFFVKTLIYTTKYSIDIIPSRKKAKDSLGLGYENAILKLCGIMKTPETLVTFFKDATNSLLQRTHTT